MDRFALDTILENGTLERFERPTQLRRIQPAHYYEYALLAERYYRERGKRLTAAMQIIVADEYGVCPDAAAWQGQHIPLL